MRPDSSSILLAYYASKQTARARAKLPQLLGVHLHLTGDACRKQRGITPLAANERPGTGAPRWALSLSLASLSLLEYQGPPLACDSERVRRDFERLGYMRSYILVKS